MNYSVLLTEEIAESGKELLRNNNYEIKIGTGITEDIVIHEAMNCDAILTRNAQITPKIMGACPKLKVISMHGVGVNSIDVDYATRLGIQVTNAATANQSSVAEYTLGLILMLAKNLNLYNNELKKGNWNIRKVCGMDLEGKTLGIIGMGKIGTMVAHKAHYGFGMKVLGYKRKINGTEDAKFATLTNDWEYLIGSSDFLSLHLPSTPSTAHLFGKKELALMKSTAYLINTGRGEVVDEAALILALQTGAIAGAAIDVFDNGIPEMDNLLLHMPNTIVTPHTASFTSQSLERMAYQSALGIVETLENKQISFPVNQIHIINDKIS